MISIPISYTELFYSFGRLRGVGGGGAVVVGRFVQGCHQGRFGGFTGIKRRRLNDNIDTANQNHEISTVSQRRILLAVQSVMA